MIIRGTVGINSKFKIGQVFTFRHRKGMNVFIKEFLGEYFYYDLEMQALASMPSNARLFHTVTVHKTLSSKAIEFFKKKLKDKKDILIDVT